MRIPVQRIPDTKDTIHEGFENMKCSAVMIPDAVFVVQESLHDVDAAGAAVAVGMRWACWLWTPEGSSRADSSRIKRCGRRRIFEEVAGSIQGRYEQGRAGYESWPIQ